MARYQNVLSDFTNYRRATPSKFLNSGGKTWEPDPNHDYSVFRKEFYFFYGTLVDTKTLTEMLSRKDHWLQLQALGLLYPALVDKVDSKFGQREPSSPVVLHQGNISSQGLFQNSIGGLYLSIRFRMECCRQISLGARKMA